MRETVDTAARRLFPVAAVLLLGGLPGCVLVDVSVTNPAPNVSRVAVVPFFNQSQEQSVDPQRFGLAYYAELQKIPGYEVVPVGVTLQTIADNGLQMTGPRDTLKLAELLDVDAVVIGSVTDYDPYYPPRVGLHVEWYSRTPPLFSPGVPVEPVARRGIAPSLWDRVKNFRWRQLPFVARAQSPPRRLDVDEGPMGDSTLRRAPANGDPSTRDEPERLPPPTITDDVPADEVPAENAPPRALAPLEVPVVPFDPTTPIMSYTRVFDGKDAEVTARLKDYVALTGDLRSGGWEAYLHRSEDFIRFACHVMIEDMLALHGGESRKRFVFKLPSP